MLGLRAFVATTAITTTTHLAYGFRGLEYMMVEQTHGAGTADILISNSKQEAESILGKAYSETLQHAPSGHLFQQGPTS